MQRELHDLVAIHGFWAESPSLHWEMERVSGSLSMSLAARGAEADAFMQHRDLEALSKLLAAWARKFEIGWAMSLSGTDLGGISPRGRRSVTLLRYLAGLKREGKVTGDSARDARRAAKLLDETS
jgi:hypothetical protein